MQKKYIAVLLFLAASLSGFSQAGRLLSDLYLFSDREYCASGDTVWYKVALVKGLPGTSNVVHVHLTNAANRLISSSVRKCENEWAEGYIFVPDSLSTGVYFLTAFYNSQRSTDGLYVQKKSLFVYNRFSGPVTELAVPSPENSKAEVNTNSAIRFNLGKSLYHSREKFSGNIQLGNIAASGVKQVVVRAAYADELAEETGGSFYVSSAVKPHIASFYQESDGILISGKVTGPGSEMPDQHVVVLFSLLNDPDYFDYCVTDLQGRFDFFLKNAYGTGDVVLQAVSKNDAEWVVKLDTVQLNATAPVSMENRKLSEGQGKFIEETVAAAFIGKLFGNEYMPEFDSFYMPSRYELPFYGKNFNRVVLSDFIGLPDFQEISRELLHGVQFRRRNEDISIRMLNLNANLYFKNEPLRLINGIPVFNNQVLASMGSDEIDYIDYIMEERIYGDLIFSGILAVYLRDPSYRWINRQKNLYRFNVPLLQFNSTPGYAQAKTVDDNTPDFRRTLYWKLHDTLRPLQVEFYLSDIKGRVKVSVEGVTDEGEIFEAFEYIEVK